MTGEGVSGLYLREPIDLYKTTRTGSELKTHIFVLRERSTLCTERTNRKRGNSFLANREKLGKADRRPTRASAKRGPHLPLCLEGSTTILY